MNVLKCIVVSIFLAACAFPCMQAAATPVLITFDAGDAAGGVAAGATLGSQYAAFGVTFAPNGFTGIGGPTHDWASNTSMVIASSSGADVGALGLPAPARGNLLRSRSGWMGEDGDPSFSVNFSTGITAFSADFIGVDRPANTRLFAYNGSTLLGSAAGSAHGQFTLSVSSATLIDRVVITPGNFSDWVGVDNITFSPVDANSVPEPASFAMLGLGLGLLGLGGMARRYPRAVSTARVAARRAGPTNLQPFMSAARRAAICGYRPGNTAVEDAFRIARTV